MFLVTCIEGPVLAVVLRGGPDVAEAQAGELLGGGEEVEEGHHQGAASYQERDQVVGGGVDGHQSQQTWRQQGIVKQGDFRRLSHLRCSWRRGAFPRTCPPGGWWPPPGRRGWVGEKCWALLPCLLSGCEWLRVWIFSAQCSPWSLWPHGAGVSSQMYSPAPEHLHNNATSYRTKTIRTSAINIFYSRLGMYWRVKTSLN